MKGRLSRLLSPVTGALTAWNHFWFTPTDPTPLGLMRIACGLVVLYVHLLHGWHLEDWFGREAVFDLACADEIRRDAAWIPPPSGWEAPQQDPFPADPEMQASWLAYYERWGADPRTTSRGQASWSIWFHVTDPQSMLLLHHLILVVMILFTLGMWTRVTSALTLLAALSYVHRAPEITFGLDAVMTAALCYLTLGPSGAALSLDSLLARKRQIANGIRAGVPVASQARPEPLTLATVALRLCQIHVCLIYLIAGLAKLLGPSWWNGMAIWSILINTDMAPYSSPLYSHFLQWLVQHRWLQELLQNTLAFFTVGIEIAFVFLIWNKRWRGSIIVGVVLLHVGIGALMDIATFGAMMLCMVASFIPAGVIQESLRYRARRHGMYRLVHGRDQADLAALCLALDWGERLILEEKEGKEATALIGEDGEKYTGGALLRTMARLCPLLWPLRLLLWLVPVANVSPMVTPRGSD